MGNTNTKESRPSGYPEGFVDGQERRNDFGDGMGLGRSYIVDPATLARQQAGRGDRGLFSLGNSASRNRERPDAPFEHRETRAEREARRLERERVARAKERERSIREEHVDGGFLVTLGTYTGTEDFSKPVTRQLQIERKLAPFWQGLNDWSDNWAEHQIIAAARGLPVPAADATPDPALAPRLPQPLDPLPGQTMFDMAVGTPSDGGSGNNSALPSPSTVGPSKGAIKPRARALAAALSVGSRDASSTDLTPKEHYLAYDPFVNGQPIEVFLYKDATECPICFLTYPPYLNHTRCCDQPICTECFVQIKRADPHLPEHHPDGQARDPNQGLTPDDPPEMLISEPSTCPYCQQPEFGVTYEPPPFRRGLAFASSSSNLGQSSALSSSQTSLNSTLSPSPTTAFGRRRTHSLSANAPNVITTDRIRPDWATKLATARAHQARRAAAATALHTAAFLMNGTESRSRLRTATRFGRRNTGTNSGGASTPGGEQSASNDAAGAEPSERAPSGNPEPSRRNRMEELEDMMFMEAVRLSLAAEEERKRKEEKVQKKEAKKREQAEKKAAKKAAKDPYGGGLSGGSRSSLSLGLGRKRAGSTASNLRMEATVQAATQSSKADEPATPEHEVVGEEAKGKGKGIDRGAQEAAQESTATSSSLPIPVRGSHLRQMSNASSLGSSFADSQTGSYPGHGFPASDGTNRRASRLSVSNRSEDGDRDTGSEPMFNFRSLAELVGVNIDDGSAMRDPDTTEEGAVTNSSKGKEDLKQDTRAEHVEELPVTEAAAEESLDATENAIPPPLSPEVTITPDTPALRSDGFSDSKQLGHTSLTEHEPESIAR